MAGYVFLWRSLSDNPLWQEETFTRGQAWVDLLLLANWKPGQIRRRGIKVCVNRGEVGTSLRELASRWKWSLGKVQRFFDELKTDTQIHYRTDTENVNVTTLICITNYEKYQKVNTETDTENDTETDTETIRRRVQNEEGKEVKEGKEKVKRFVPPSLLEVETYISENKFSVIAQNWIDHYSSNGWKVGKNKMVDWKAAVRTWQKNNFTNGGKQNGQSSLARLFSGTDGKN